MEFINSRFFKGARISFFMSLVLMLFAAGCSKDANNGNPVGPGGNTGTNSITLNGGGYTNRTIQLTSSSSFYNSASGVTIAGFAGIIDNNDSIYVTLTFKGNSSANYQIKSGEQDNIIFILIGRKTNHENIREITTTDQDTGLIRVTSYGQVGSAVAGTFTTTATQLNDNQKVNLTGSFSATRQANQGGGGNQDGTNKVTLNGGGFNNLTYEFTIANAAFVTSVNTTAVYMTKVQGSDTVNVYLAFPGKQTGTFSWEMVSVNANAYAMIEIFSSTNQIQLISIQNSGQTIVNGYGSVGQKIDGTFSGKLFDVATSTEVNISGQLSALRVPDAQ